MNDETKPPAESDLTLPKALVEALHRVDGANPGTAGLQARSAAPSEFFAKAQVAIAAARAADIAQLNARRRRMRFALWSAGSLLAAACVALVVSLSLHAPARERTGDIRDAFALARALRDGAQVSAADDFNHDGSVDGADVRALAMVAVSLKGGR